MPFDALNAAQGAALTYHQRQRRRARVDPADGLFVTRRFTAADNDFDPRAIFGAYRTLPTTFAVAIQRTDADPVGVVFETGSATTGLAVWISRPGTTREPCDVNACAGDAGDDGVTLTARAALPSLLASPPSGSQPLVRVVFAVHPGTGAARLWINGRLAARGSAVNGALPNGWSDDDDGAIGDVGGAGVSARVTSGEDVTLAEAAVRGPVVWFAGQRPRAEGL